MRELDDINLELAAENVDRRRVRDGGGRRGERGRASSSALRTRSKRSAPGARSRGGRSRRRRRGAGLEMSPREAFLGPQEVVPFADAVGRLAAESLAAYPPGIPNVLPGERLTQETIDYISALVEHGGWVRGAVDRSLRTR